MGPSHRHESWFYYDHVLVTFGITFGVDFDDFPRTFGITFGIDVDDIPISFGITFGGDVYDFL